MSIYRIALLGFILCVIGCGERFQQQPTDEGLRIISLAPNVTEILYALGLNDQVVGVSKYSVYPPESSDKPSVGGTYDPNWEIILSLQPDLVIGLDSQQEISSQLEQLALDFLGVPHERIDEIIQSILIIGKTCGVEDRAHAILAPLQDAISVSSSTTNPPSVLICIGHDESLSRMYIAARNTFYDDLIHLAGGINACQQTAVKYPEISQEGLHAMNPDIIIDLFPPNQNLSLDLSTLWAPYHSVIMTNQYAFIPGPRFTLLLEDISQAIRQNYFEAE